MELDSEDKPILDLAVPTEQGQDSESRPHESGEEEGEDVKKKKPSESDDDDDEPPPPYSKNDPVEDDKSDNEGGDPSSAAASNSGSGQAGGVGGASNEGEITREPERESETATSDHRRIQNPSDSFGFEVQLGNTSTAQQSHSRSSENVQSSENETDASRPSSQAQRSPASMSRISSPERGRTLSELTRITPEDESRLGQCGGSVATTNTLPLPTQDDQLESVYSSDTTLVNSESQPSQTEISHESSVSSIITDASGTPRVQHQKKKEKKSTRLKIRGRKNDKAKSSSSDGKLNVNRKDTPGSLDNKKRKHRLHSPLHKVPSPHNLSVNYNSLSQQAFTSSQDSNFDIGLSPEGESGEHSSEVDMEPREIRIKREGNSSLGLSITYDDKTNAIVVKSVSSSGAVAKDGRIRVGDRIESINGKSMIGVNSSKARHILKKASKLDELAIVYVPAIQTYIPASGYSGKRQMSSEMSLNDSQGSLLSTESGGERQQQPSASYHQQLTMSSQMPQGDAPSLMTSQSGGMTHHPPPPPQGVQAMHMGPQITSAGMSRLVQPTPQWPGYHHSNIAPPPRTMTRGYYDDQMGKPPPPPYGYPHQSTTTPPQGILPNQPGAYPSLATPWNMHSTPPQPPPSGMHIVGMMQAPPSMIPHPHWGMAASRPPPPHPSMIPPHREPPQYTDFHAMAATQQMASAGVQQNQIHAQYQNFNSTTSGAHMSSMHSSGGGGMAMTGSGSGLPSQQQQQQQVSQLPPRPMNKSQSESKFQSGSQGGQQPRSGHERRHNSQGTSDGGQLPFQVGYHQNRPVEVRRHSSKQKHSSSSQKRQQLIEDEFHESGQKPWLSQEAAVVHRSSSGGEGFANRKARSQPNISQGGSGGGGGGAPERERPERARHTKYPRAATLQESPDHSHHNSWAINDEEDPALRDEFPDVDGHLFEVWLKKGKTGGLGLSIVANTTSQALRGIVIMGMYM